ncbi:hypothetical protein EHO61_01880 [Leptospira fluminis]|uniref:Uncharacterized protein n=1 Tax=Leptospira fluminis TaxID=2484979 RepID=A0A4R9GUV2_9LEPT|nr:hypothetical protein [Leptospira fluminis]TGK22006.1 hypothetical protein EHO61_01880 [Leptospira fluminis]
MKGRAFAFILFLFLGDCYTSTLFYFDNIRMKEVPPDVRSGLYKQEESDCKENLETLLERIRKKSPNATHVRDLEVFKTDLGFGNRCLRVRYGLEISR